MTKETLTCLNLCAGNTATGKAYVSAESLRALLAERETLLAELKRLTNNSPKPQHVKSTPQWAAAFVDSLATARAAIAEATGEEVA